MGWEDFGQKIADAGKDVSDQSEKSGRSCMPEAEARQ